jgi:diguanylate cyclase (GGDEF)-like protein
LAATLFDNQGGSFLHFVIDAESCVACLACVRDCPTDAIAVAGEAPLLQVVDELCIRCGQCYAVCPHDAVRVNGEVGRALAIASQGDGILILSPEMAAHFYPATPEQVVNACYEAGFRTVTRGVIGDELVAAEYLKLWREEPWGTLIRSTDPVVVDTVRAQFPELIPYLAPVTTPPVAEARHLRVRFGPGLRIVHAGVNASEGAPDLDAAITFGDLEEVLKARGVNILGQPTWFSRVPEERRRHQSAAGGMPLELLEEFKQASARFRLVRGLDQLPAIARAVSVDRMDLGFVDILSYEGLLDHPLAGPKDQLFWRRALIASTEPPRAPTPVLDRTVVASVGAIFQIQPERMEPDSETVAAILKEIGLGPNGRPWDCGACGFDTCQKFAETAAAGRASLRQCLPYQERRAEDAQKAAAVDLLTGLSTYRVLRDRLSFEIERSRRNGETFAVLFLDLDRFKQVNDTYGHEAGNEILRAASAEIRNAVRASDVAARYGGDEFVVILTRTDLAGATRVAEALRAGIEGVGRRLGYESGLITVSCGIAEFDPKQPGEGDLLVTADRALYRAKAAGRNVVA